jgi:hypothetical protein
MTVDTLNRSTQGARNPLDARTDTTQPHTSVDASRSSARRRRTLNIVVSCLELLSRNSLDNNFTSHFSAQNFSDLIPVHSGLVLTRAGTDYFLCHCFKRVRLIADVAGISRHVFVRNLEIHIGLIR